MSRRVMMPGLIRSLIRGRDRTGDLVDCSAATMPGEWQNELLDRIVQSLIDPFGISVTVDTDIGEPFRKFRIDEGETVFEAIDRACRYSGRAAVVRW